MYFLARLHVVFPFVYHIKFQSLYGRRCSKRDEVTGQWSKLHNEGLNDLYSLPNIVRVGKYPYRAMEKAA